MGLFIKQRIGYIQEKPVETRNILLMGSGGLEGLQGIRVISTSESITRIAHQERDTQNIGMFLLEGERMKREN